MADTLYLDLETYSTQVLKVVGAYRYSEDPSYLTLLVGWALNDGPVHCGPADDPEWLAVRRHMLEDADVTKVAHNASFDRIGVSRDVYGKGTDFLSPESWVDTMAIATSKGLPASLANVAKALKVSDKDEAGQALIRLFCKPNRGRRVMPQDKPVQWAEFVAYCVQDVATLREVHQALGGWQTQSEADTYTADQLINDRGIRVDMPLVRAAIESSKDYTIATDLQLTQMTGLANPNSRDQFLGWLHEQRVPVTNLQKETVEKLLENQDLDGTVRDALELRSGLALAAVKKFPTIAASVCQDHRLRGQFKFFGAHTGRWSSRGVQLHNLTRASLDREVWRCVYRKSPCTADDPHPYGCDWAHDTSSTDAAVLDLLMGLGASMHTLKSLVRSCLLLDGAVVDYSSIEARVIAWLAGEAWAIDAFNRGRDIYVETAQRMSTPEKQLNRSQGKVAVLALGYNGGVASLRAMGASGTDEELQLLVDQWRRANPSIVKLWKLLDTAFWRGGKAGRLEVVVDGSTRHLLLPSGRSIVYRHVRRTMEQTKYGERMVLSFQTTMGYRAKTYGGSLSENATQAVARDLLAAALVALEDAGYPVVGHVHDEILVEAKGSLKEVRRLMCASPEWAAGLPVDGAGFECYRYRKG